ncbi:hypothetical protein DFH94DRAFT_682532 [Russula ochroleuca]|uniref:Transmembrane protein n=1 Tax=Russula ochroleuca TaxID=152965 RepID=A0A9P5MUA1_9AGAM|nr:hypothetical protein DFH94DRAFT_682532 [Russula ochroleuca]
MAPRFFVLLHHTDPFVSPRLKVSLLVINAMLPLIAIITLDNVATGLEITLVTCTLLASVILVAMLFYKILMRSCVFNDVKRDKKALCCVTVLDVCVAIGWAIRLDRTVVFCTRPEHGSCHTALIVLGLILAWISVIVSLCATMCANHGRKKRRPSPLQLYSSRPVISSPVLVHAGQFTEEDDRKLGGFTDIPLEHLGAGEAGPWNPI